MILTLTPSRFTPLFVDGDYAYVMADRAVTKNGRLLTPTPIVVYADAGGVISFDLIPNAEVDEAEEFKYVVAAYNATGGRIYIHEIEVTDADASIFDFIPEPVDLNACAAPVPLTDNSV